MGAAGVAVAVLGCLAVSAGPARADGDPASDVLALQRLFVPVELSPSPQTQELQALLAEADRVGFPIRVALIDAASDLGSVTWLWGRPFRYAQYLWTELSELYGGQVLVVMPGGFGIYGPPHGPGAVGAGELHVKALSPAAGPKLVTAALSAVRLLASAAGQQLPAVANPTGSATAERTTGGGIDPLALLVLLAGSLAIAACWGLSIARRPLQVHRRPST